MALRPWGIEACPRGRHTGSKNGAGRLRSVLSILVILPLCNCSIASYIRLWTTPSTPPKSFGTYRAEKKNDLCMRPSPGGEIAKAFAGRRPGER